MDGIVDLVVEVEEDICRIMRMERRGCRVLLSTNGSAGDKDTLFSFDIEDTKAEQNENLFYFFCYEILLTPF